MVFPAQEEKNPVTISPGDPGSEETNDNPLAGTCQRGQRCGSPHCRFWMDTNGNGPGD